LVLPAAEAATGAAPVVDIDSPTGFITAVPERSPAICQAPSPLSYGNRPSAAPYRVRHPLNMRVEEL